MEQTKALDPAGASGASGNAGGLLQDLPFLWHELRSLVHDQLTLAALETRHAGESLVHMLIAGVLIAVLLISAWLGLMAAGILWLASLGMKAAFAILGAVAANLIAAGILYAFLRRRSRALQFPSTLRSLRPLPLKTHVEAKS